MTNNNQPRREKRFSNRELLKLAVDTIEELLGQHCETPPSDRLHLKYCAHVEAWKALAQIKAGMGNVTPAGLQTLEDPVNDPEVQS